MNNQQKVFSRREILAMAIGVGGLSASGNSVLAQEATRLFTPPLELGPFYPVAHPKDIDADLTVLKGRKTRAEGAIVHVAGRVLNQKGEPVAGAKIEIWQANTHGRYAHKSDRNTAPLDPNFQGYAVLKTDSQGRYHFKTIKPGAYPISPTAQRTRHIHFDVTGRDDRLITQMFFPDEPLNDIDPVFLELRARYKLFKMPISNANVIVAKSMPPTKKIETGAMMLNWDIII